ncbi:MAG: DUF1501 domain-containing protein, partial [Planctomycetaceae bacterium]|nr:DUF1501 domain-containing protein [Planctomycetaceae bacterium]
MFNLVASGSQSTCEGVTRRELLQIGTLGIGGLSLAQLFQLEAAAGTQAGSLLRDKAVVVLNLQGGPTHIETFDPKMTAPAEYRAMFGEAQTALPGVTFGAHFPMLAARAHHMAIVRCYSHGNSNHATAAKLVMAGGNSTGAQMGVLLSRLVGSNSPRTGMPINSVLPPKALGEKFAKLGGQTDRVTDIGTLPSSYRPFDPSAGSEVVRNMQLSIQEQRLDDRRSLLTQLDGLRREAEASDLLAGSDAFQQQAFDVIVGGISEAFNLDQESAATRARYDTSQFTIPRHVAKKKSNVPGQAPIALGQQMLLARRLVEHDCRFVTVTSSGWDMHGNAFGINDGMPILGPAVDRAASAFLDDLRERGMADRVLLVITGEFGRTPKINTKGGRDHWGNLCTLAFAGG